jgi:hypothetical protein
MEVYTAAPRFLTIEECDHVNSFVETLKCRRSFDLGSLELKDQAEIIQEWFDEWYKCTWGNWEAFCNEVLLEN